MTTQDTIREILIKADDCLVGLALQIEHKFEELAGQPVDWDPDANFTPLEHQLHVIAEEFGMDYKDIAAEAYHRRKERRKEIEDRRRQLEEGMI